MSTFDRSMFCKPVCLVFKRFKTPLSVFVLDPMAIEVFYAMATANYFKSIRPCWYGGGNSNYTDWQRLP